MQSKLACAALFIFSGLAHAQELRFAELGSLPLERGGVLNGCRMGYRTIGKLAPDKSNVILFPTWAAGRSEQALALAKPDGLLNTSRFYVVLVDALANGVSCSPSNSQTQPRMAFPQITIHDMVVAEHELLTKQLHLDHVYAVVGESMGGMQTFDWMVSYPKFMDRAIPIIGSPKLGGYDLLLWQTEIDAIERDASWMNGNYTQNPAAEAEARIGLMSLMTPAMVNAQFKDGRIPDAFLKSAAQMDANNRIRQAQAMMALDVSNCCDHSMPNAAKRVQAKVLIIVEKQDHTVTPGPALDFAKLLGAPTVVLDSDCGHLGPGTCDAEDVRLQVNAFLTQP